MVSVVRGTLPVLMHVVAESVVEARLRMVLVVPEVCFDQVQSAPGFYWNCSARRSQQLSGPDV